MAMMLADDLRLIRDVVSARPQAWDVFVGRIADSVWTACLVLEGGEAGARIAFALVLEGLCEDGFRRLRPYNGTSRIETFVILLTREILIERLLRRLVEAPRTDAWAAVEHFFAADIRRIVSRRLPGDEAEEARRDAYQEICLHLVDGEFRRLKAYKGNGSFGGFVLHMVDNLAVDIVRRSHGRGDGGLRPRPAVLDDGQWQAIPCPAPSPEQRLLGAEEEDLLGQASAILAHLTKTLPPAEALYLRMALSGAEPLPARDVARLMGVPVTEVYALKQKLMKHLREILSHHPAIKKWREIV